MKNIFLTGSRGVLGSEILSICREIGEIRVYEFAGDVRSRDAVREFLSQEAEDPFLVHCAAVVPTHQVEREPYRAYEVNVMGTGVVFSEFRSNHPDGHATYISTSHVYQPTTKEKLSENSATNPHSAYGRSKLAGEYVAQDTFGGQAESLAILRLFSMFSDKQDSSFLYPSLMSTLRAHDDKTPLTLRGWNNVRDFSSASTHAGKVLSVSLARFGGIMNIGSGVGKTIGQFAEEIAGRPLEFSQDFADLRPNSLVADTSLYSQSQLRF